MLSAVGCSISLTRIGGAASFITATLQFGVDPLQMRMLPKSRSGLLRTCVPVAGSTTIFTRSTEIGTSWSFGNPPAATNSRNNSPCAPGTDPACESARSFGSGICGGTADGSKAAYLVCCGLRAAS